MSRIDDERPVEDLVTPSGARAGQVASASAGVPTGQAGLQELAERAPVAAYAVVKAPRDGSSSPR